MPFISTETENQTERKHGDNKEVVFVVGGGVKIENIYLQSRTLKAHLHYEKGGTDRIKIGTGTTKKSPFTQ